MVPVKLFPVLIRYFILQKIFRVLGDTIPDTRINGLMAIRMIVDRKWFYKIKRADPGSTLASKVSVTDEKLQYGGHG